MKIKIDGGAKVKRRGQLMVQAESGKECCIETPGCFLYSKGGTVPHLTRDNLKTIQSEPYVFHCPLGSIIEQPGISVMSKYGKSYAEFVAAKNDVFCCTLHDSYNDKRDIYKYNEEKSVSVWAPGGRQKVTPETYTNIAKVFGFPLLTAPSDMIQVENETAKRCRKSYDRTIRFLDSCSQSMKDKQMDSNLIGCVEGGDNKDMRTRCATEVDKRDVSGYLVSGLDASSNWKELLQVSTSYLKTDKARMMFGVFLPDEVLEAVERGVDVFDTVSACYVTDRGLAFNFQFRTKRAKLETDIIEEINGELTPEEKGHVNGNSDAAEEKANNNKSDRKDFSGCTMDLNDSRFFSDFRPLVDSCSCYTCRHHVRAYIHHLLVTKEMLAQVLLMIHNLHHWLEFFKEIRLSLDEKRFDNLKLLLNNSYDR